MLQTRKWMWLTVLLALIPGPAQADGAMSLALATFTWPMWLAYVVVTVLWEAYALGRWLGLPLGRSLRLSMWANFVTAILGGIPSGILSYSFLGLFGSVLDPNPFGQTLILFTLFGIGSALIASNTSNPFSSGI